MDTITGWITRLTKALASLTKRKSTRETASAGQPPRDFKQERETDRVDTLSEEDRAWEAASLQRNREARERDETPPGSG